MLREMIDKVYRGSAKTLMLHTLSTKKASAEELEEIRKLIEKLDDKQRMGRHCFTRPTVWAERWFIRSDRYLPPLLADHLCSPTIPAYSIKTVPDSIAHPIVCVLPTVEAV